MRLSFRILYIFHSWSLAICCGSLSRSASLSAVGCEVGLCKIRLRSSCRPSRRKLKNSCESCCSVPPNCPACAVIERYRRDSKCCAEPVQSGSHPKCVGSYVRQVPLPHFMQYVSESMCQDSLGSHRIDHIDSTSPPSI
jgi:hypothetical protein